MLGLASNLFGQNIAQIESTNKQSEKSQDTFGSKNDDNTDSTAQDNDDFAPSAKRIRSCRTSSPETTKSFSKRMIREGSSKPSILSIASIAHDAQIIVQVDLELGLL